MIPDRPTEHPSEEELLLHLDGPAPSRIGEHAADCATCGQRLAELRRTRDAVDRLLGTLQPADAERYLPPTLAEVVAARAPRPAPPLRRAAVLAALLLAGGAAAAVPLLRERSEPSLPSVPAPPPDPGAPPAAAPPVQTPAAVRFVPRPGVLAVEFLRTQAQGSLEVQRVPGTEATFESASPAPAPHILVLPAGLRVQNSAQGRQSFRLRAPETVRLLRVQVGAEVTEVDLRRLQSAGTRTIPLGARGG
jgi:hypothetical protein